MTKVKWLELNFSKEDIEPVVELLESGKTICGFSEVVEQFEFHMKKYIDIKHALACSNGTVALFVAAEAIKRLYKIELNIAVPTWCYIAAANVADYLGTLTLIDSEENTYNIDIDKVNLDQVNVIIPADMAGIPCDYNKVASLKIPVIADNAESLGSKYYGKHVSSLSLISITSFQDAKIITTGEGGMIFTNDDDLARICKLIINQGYGSSGYATHDHIYKGFNFRLSGMQAALGIAQLNKIDNLIDKRRNIASIYRNNLDKKVNFINYDDEIQPNYYSFLIMLDNKKERDKLKKYLFDKMVECKLWKPIHLYNIYSNAVKYPNAEYIYDHHIRLPVHNNLTKEQAEIVCFHINNFLEELRN